ncbi:MAG: PAS domain S-box protein [Campylobacterota bacterium]|nr:PAS domain S-box protein [Campylobacterota bacterium]
MKKSILFSLIFILLSTISYILLNYEKNQKLQQHLNTKTKQFSQNYYVLYKEYQKLSEVIFNTKIDTLEVAKIFKDRDREQLHNHLKDTYSLLKQYNIKQLHFHLPNNESFLRFHRPNKYGDNLTNTRETVKYVNENKKQIDGFEEGRIYNGYRFVFPLFYKKKHIGSVEVSFSTLAMNIEFMDNYKVISNFMILKEKVDQKVFKSEKSNYVQSPFKKFYLEKKMIDEIAKHINIKKREPLSKNTQKLINDYGLTNKSFSTYDDVRKEIMTFIKVKNPISKKVVGIFIARSDANYIHNKTKDFITILSLLILFIAIVMVYIYKESIYKNNIKTNNKKLKAIFEEADSGIALMDLNGNFLEVNNIYSKLLGYSKDELLNLNCLELSTKNTKEIAKQIIKKAIKEGYVSKVRKECITKENQIVHLELSLTLLPSKDAFIAIVNSLEDKLQLENLNNNLQLEVDNAVEDLRTKDIMLFQQSKMAAMGEMIDSIAHQWMQPIGIIKMKLQIMKMDLDFNQLTDEKIEETATSSDKQIVHLTNTINEFRSFFRPNSKIEEIPLKAILDSSILLMQDDLIKNSIKTNITGNDTAVIKVNSSEFKHVIINIVNNAKDAFNDNNIDKENREVVFDIVTNADKTIFKIIDNAGGIPANIIGNIFEANFTTKEEGKGTGIGLYMTKQIVDKIGASIEVENINNGACFKIII